MRTARPAPVAGSLVLAVAMVLSPATKVLAADHLDAPLVQLDGRTDINDVYVFTSLTNPDNTVLIMTVNPAAGVSSGTDFDPDAFYQIFLDYENDGIPDRDATVLISPDAGFVAALLPGGGTMTGALGQTILGPSGEKLRADLFDDPFFFDLVGFQNTLATGNLSFTGDDFFAGLNVSAIVLEIPTSQIGSPDGKFSVHGRTSRLIRRQP